MIPELTVKFALWGLVLGYMAITVLGLDDWHK